ncbi:ATP-grasp domain-containing protein [Micromonospora halophytica]|uniref:ATP-grasp domain-containing protein n=1 Tax=Micromonospora halophytica TaxID=47864 RepID=A0A1C5JFE9_9ACTN|nr:ATP-grasp domain-containing protein [Micromonospora halophytica]SCG69282.1 ATP-grasp domain-containing protein [Micromonospora halophytica]
MDTNRSYVLLLGLGTSYFLRERAFSGAKDASALPVWMTSLDPLRSPQRFFDRVIAADDGYAESVLAAVAEWKRRGWLPAAVVPVNDWGVPTASAVAKEYGLPGLSADSAHVTREKYAMKARFEAAGLPTPRSASVTSEAEMLGAAGEIGFPVVIKPADFSGSGGVRLARTQDEAIAAFAASVEHIERYRDDFPIDGTRYLVEQYVDSQEEVSVEVLCHGDRRKTLTVTEKFLSAPPVFAEVGHLVPSHRTGEANLRTLAERACEALGIDRGIAHVEIKFDSTGAPWLIEAAARPGGDGIMDQMERAYGYNPYALHVASYLGIDPFPLVQDEPVCSSAVAFLKARPGEVTSVRIPEKLPESVVSVVTLKKPGDVAKPLADWSTRDGVVEMVWDEIFTERTTEPVEIADGLSEEIFG